MARLMVNPCSFCSGLMAIIAVQHFPWHRRALLGCHSLFPLAGRLP